MVTRELSLYAAKDGFCRYGVTSLKPINPDNAPDKFEKDSLLLFDQGQKEAMTIEETTEGTMLRYIAPLYTDESCLTCHAEQGYNVGDIRGGLSVSVPIDWAYASIADNNRMLLGIALGTIALVADRAMAEQPYEPRNMMDTELTYKPVKHLKAPDDAADCYECHKKATPKIAQDWYESKHGVVLMKCFVCHGQPDGEGSVPWKVQPDYRTVCRKCHEPAMKMMENKYGMDVDCAGCHQFHHNSLHHKAYGKSASKKQ